MALVLFQMRIDLPNHVALEHPTVKWMAGEAMDWRWLNSEISSTPLFDNLISHRAEDSTVPPVLDGNTTALNTPVKHKTKIWVQNTNQHNHTILLNRRRYIAFRRVRLVQQRQQTGHHAWSQRELDRNSQGTQKNATPGDLSDRLR